MRGPDVEVMVGNFFEKKQPRIRLGVITPARGGERLQGGLMKMEGACQGSKGVLEGVIIWLLGAQDHKQVWRLQGSQVCW